jgi:hypothetical protein
MRQMFDSIGPCRREKYFKHLLKAYLMIVVPGLNEAKCFYFVSNHIKDNREGCLRLPMQLYVDLVSVLISSLLLIQASIIEIHSFFLCFFKRFLDSDCMAERVKVGVVHHRKLIESN